MKRLILILSILLLTGGAAGASVLRLKTASETMAETLSRAASLSETSPQKALETVEQLQIFWEQTEKQLEFFLYEEHLHRLSEQLEHCRLYLADGRTEEFSRLAALTGWEAQHLYEEQRPDFSNIF